jgi:hypothetical protein
MSFPERRDSNVGTGQFIQKKPPTFDGNGSWQDFLVQFEMISPWRVSAGPVALVRMTPEIFLLPPPVV